MKLPAVFVHAPAVAAVPVALQREKVAQGVTLGHILVMPWAAPIVLQKALSPALTHCLWPLGWL